MKYLSANEYYKRRFGKKMYKASVSLKVTCPNRDGSKGFGGCIFCSEGGSGEFAEEAGKPVSKQIDDAIQKVAKKAGEGAGYIAYFQSFTNTYCDADYLKRSLEETAAHPMVEAVALGTRPDALPEDIVDVLSQINKRIPLFVELGLQTSNDETGRLINRCFDTADFINAADTLHRNNIEVTAHVIFGLPGESEEDMLNTVRLVKDTGCEGVKFTCLYVLEGTRLAEMYRNNEFEVPGMEEYFDIVEKAIDIIPDDMAVMRLTGDGPKSMLIAPEWTKNKRNVINYINRRFGNG